MSGRPYAWFLQSFLWEKVIVSEIERSLLLRNGVPIELDRSSAHPAAPNLI